MKHTVAIAQIDCALGDLKRNLEKHIHYIQLAIKEKAKLILFPELSLTGYTLRDITVEIAVNPFKSNTFDDLKKLSKEIIIIAGGVEEGENYGLYNSAFVFEDGEIKHIHRKIYPPTYGMFEEMRYFSNGNKVQAFNTKIGRMGVLICEDLWHISLPYLLAIDGATIIAGLAASPTRISTDSEELTNYKINSEHHKTYARLLSVYLLFSNRVGYEDGVNFWGGSEVVNSDGEVIAVAKLFEEDLIFAEIDFNTIKRSRQFSRHFIDENPILVERELKRILKM
ncbi:Predicted amidohydrolase [Candidatus Kryptonium thompsonii]|uniref:Predicted amidohydrolase n=1 Tax=Candidatus Kryptonium thompsonii TaxID=1633631 RepID=A0A0P1LIG2_9BACT|nr:nitrilase-related carbon-nitrogen hydrolase [Candidatus Kryptonium thompsoni]CUS78475.1 Predicted amidohydrolase [Candidatus Kryptonium thompsoni]CUS79959.1 Predicted amidohydrolase [Candidatus Kryptonium thompsoni]CUS81326.1 Predicted amidohydrolase [Candidatus Kryptonium thompsoni]CUS84384.1 Predicted amidohydrolase [Candidatus Kryptonium thompsoni]CUS86925.1 Predicted amidohydrolase [Candidatus Kryptonium thompsoni]